MAFWSGLILGASACAWFLGSALCYLFTNKLPSIEMSPDQRPRLALIDVDRLYETPVVMPTRAAEAEEAV
jgi:hypothetical protein